MPSWCRSSRHGGGRGDGCGGDGLCGRLAMGGLGKVEELVDAPTKREQRLLDFVAHLALSDGKVFDGGVVLGAATLGRRVICRTAAAHFRAKAVAAGSGRHWVVVRRVVERTHRVGRVVPTGARGGIPTPRVR